MGARAVGDEGTHQPVVVLDCLYRAVILSAKPLRGYILSSITQLNLPSQGLTIDG